MKRNLYLDVQDKETALENFLNALEGAVPDSETIPVTESLGRVTAEAVFAKWSSPSYNSCAMDGIAVISSHTKGASENSPLLLKEGEDYLEADTGDMILPPYDAVIMAEELIETEEGYQIIAPTHPFAHVRAVGEDIVASEMVLPSGHKIRAVDISALLAAGVGTVQVIRRPVVGIIPTGDEMISYKDITEQGEVTGPEDGHIVETNSWLFEGLARENGAVGRRYDIVPDRPELLEEAVMRAVEECDIIIVNAGSSAGRDDYAVHVIRKQGDVLTHGVSIKPGKPVILGKVQGKPVIGLPGYPVSAYLTFMEFVVPVINRFLTGESQPAEKVRAKLTKTVMSGLKYEEYLRVKLGIVDGELIAAPLSRGAGASMSLVKADGFCLIPKNSEGVMAHEEVEVRLLEKPEQIGKTLVVIGSHDIILDVLNDLITEEHTGMRLSSTHVGSMSGLIALKKHETHLAPSHLLCEEDGSYNEAVVREIFPGEKMVIIKGVRRRQGFIVKKGNPLHIRKIADITPEIRYINRQKGAGTRVLFDYLMKKESVSPEEIQGYKHEAATHMAVAVAVQKDNADVGMGIYSCAKAMDLDFVDVAFEEYDFVTREEYLDLPLVQEFLRVLRSSEFRRKLEELGGYTAEEIGEIQYIRWGMTPASTGGE